MTDIRGFWRAYRTVRRLWPMLWRRESVKIAWRERRRV